MNKNAKNQRSNLNKKLTLNKQTVALLGREELARVAGGDYLTTPLDGCVPGQYQTYEFSLCVC